MQKWFQEKITDAKVLDISMEVYKKKFKSLICYQFLFAIIMIVTLIAGSLAILPMLFLINPDGILEFVLLMVFLIMIIGTFLGLNNVGIFHITHGYINGENISASDALGRAFSSFKYIFRIVGALAICLVPILFILGFLGVTATLLTVFRQQMGSGVLTSILLNALLFSFITAVIGSFLFYSLHIAVFDKEKGFASIKKSMRFAKGEVLKNAFRVLSISMFHWGVNVSLFASIAAAAGLLSFLFGKVQGGESIIAMMTVYGSTGESIIEFIVGILLKPISSVIWTVYYINMKYKKEGLKIKNMVESLEQKVSEKLSENIDIHYE